MKSYQKSFCSYILVENQIMVCLKAFTFREDSIVVIILLQRIKEVGNKKELNSRRQRIIIEMRDNPNITTVNCIKYWGLVKQQ